MALSPEQQAEVKRDLSNALLLEEAAGECAIDLCMRGYIEATQIRDVAKVAKTYMKTACQSWHRISG